MIGFFLAVTLLIGGTAQAGPNWESYGMKIAAGEEGAVLAVIEKFMATKAGKAMPGSYSLMSSWMNGSDPTTHSIIWATDSIAEREKYIRSMEGNADWAALITSLSRATDSWASYRMAFDKTWGESGESDSVWYIYPAALADPAAYQSAMDELMNSKVAKKFKGSLVLSRIVAGGVVSASHLISQGFESEAEAEKWDEVLTASPEFAAFRKATEGSSKYMGTSILYTVKSWGGMTPE